MHDIHAAQQILKLVLKYAEKNRLEKINSITVELGKIVEHNELITPENLEYNIRIIARNTLAENCKILIKRGSKNELKLVEIDGRQRANSKKSV